MRAELTREGHPVGVFIMARDGDYTLDCSNEALERLKPIIETIIEELREPYAAVGRGVPEPRTYKPGDPRWFDRVLARLQNKGYEHVVLDDQ